MNTKSAISHRGKILEITPEWTSVEILSDSACSSCHARGLCGMSEQQTKIVQVPSNGWAQWDEGDEVEVLLKESLGHKAVWLAYVIPLVLIVAVLLSALSAGLDDLLSTLAAFLVIVVYYAVLYLCRDKIAKEYIFTIKK